MSRLDCVRQTLRLALEFLAAWNGAAAWEAWFSLYGERPPEELRHAARPTMSRAMACAGEDMRELLARVDQLGEAVGQAQPIQLLRRVFTEQFVCADDGSVGAASAAPPGAVINPHDPEAQWSTKHTLDPKGWTGFKQQICETAVETPRAPRVPTAAASPPTERRRKAVEAMGMLDVGCGVSGGEEGALKGPCLMPGGSAAAWPHIREMLRAIAARTPDGEPCCDWVGSDGAGHYVKMVHNGIEYGDMQLIAEAYHLLRDGAGLSNDEMHLVFAEWNRGDLDSYLIEITAAILGVIDPETGVPLVDVILDEARQKGTGKWTSQYALDGKTEYLGFVNIKRKV